MTAPTDPQLNPPQTHIGGNIHGDVVGSDKVGGDKVAGNKIERQTIYDQHGQTVQGDQVNAGRDVIINQPPEPSPGPPDRRFWQIAVSVGIIITIITGVVTIFSDSLSIISYLATETPTATATSTTTPTPSPSPTPLAFLPEQTDETLILMTAFYETTATKSQPHTKIRRAIQSVAERVGLDTLRVIEEETAFLKADQREEAEALGRLYNASMVIWGEDTGVEVIVNFLNLKEPNYTVSSVQIEERERVQLANPAAYTEFIVEELPDQITFFSLFAVSDSYYSAEDYEQALTTIEAAIVAALNSGTEPKGLAQAYFRAGWLYQVPFPNPEKAIQNYDQAVALDPKFALAYYNRAIAYYNQGDYKQAIADYDQVIALDPESVNAYNNRGNAYHYQGDYKQAITDYDQAIALDPEYANAYNNRGNTYYRQGNYEQAISDYDQAVAFDSEFAFAYNNSCWTKSLAGRAREAIAACNQAILLDPDNGYFNDSRGLARALTGDYLGAVEDFKIAVAWFRDRGFEQYAHKRASWIVELEADENPFDEKTLEILRNEASPKF